MTESLIARGRVLAVHADHAVTVECRLACPGCRCGRILGRRPRQIELPVEWPDQCGVGADVEISAPAAELLRASIWVYGLPWSLMLGGTLLGTWLVQSDAAALAGAVLGLAAGGVALRAFMGTVTAPRLGVRAAR